MAVGRICIDSNSMGDVVEDLVIRDRRHLSEDGIVLPIIAINKLTGKVETSPEIVMRGFSASTAEDGFLDQARLIVMNTLEAFERRRAGRLRRDQGEDPPGLETLHREEHLAPAADHAGHSRNLSMVTLEQIQGRAGAIAWNRGAHAVDSATSLPRTTRAMKPQPQTTSSLVQA